MVNFMVIYYHHRYWGWNMIDKPPSRIRYETKHPTISVRVTKDLKEALDRFSQDVGGLSYAQIIKEGLESAKELDKISKIQYELGYEEGFKDGKKKYRIAIPCSICGKEILLEPGSPIHKDAIKLLMAKGWAHGECADKKSSEQRKG